jgi:hypothetical protein
LSHKNSEITSLRIRRVWRYQSCNQNPYIEEEEIAFLVREKLDCLLILIYSIYSFKIIYYPVFSRVCVSRSFVLCVCFVDRCLSFCPFSFGHCVVCSFSIYWFWDDLLVTTCSIHDKVSYLGNWLIDTKKWHNINNIWHAIYLAGLNWY